MQNLAADRRPARPLRAWAAAAFAAGLLVAPAEAATTVSDSTFANANWTLTQFALGTGGSVVATQVSQSGNFLRSVADTVNNATPGITSAIYSTSIYGPFTYNPSGAGAIATVDYAENAICLADCFGQGQSTGAAILQNGKLYITTAFLITGPATTSHPLSLTGLTASSFSLVSLSQTNCCDLTQHPDFSASGAPMQFGFYRANGTSVGGGGYTLTAGIDDWVIAINNSAPAVFAAPIPALEAWGFVVLAALIVAAAGIARRKSV